MWTGDAFDASRFARRLQESVLGVTAFVSTPEDTILAKLRWARMSGGSEKQFGDALRVFEAQRRRLDLGYLERRVDELGLAELWGRLLAEAVTD
jgi:hypothetical protein